MLEHLHSRDLDTRLHTVWLDEEVATFPLWNLTGQMTGYMTYRPGADKERRNDPRSGRYFTYRQKQLVSVWGLESWHLTPGHLFVTEGVFDAARLTLRGFSAVAVLSYYPSPPTRHWLRLTGRFITAVCDDNPDGHKLGRLADRTVITPGGDLGDMEAAWVDRLVLDTSRCYTVD